MKRMTMVAALQAVALLTGTQHAVQAQDFYAHWGDGRAELSSYRVVQPRYGEPREGYGVFVFVTEDIHANTLIKVETPSTPKADRIYTLKLNSVLKFTTGIYDYSVMTSVFSAVEPRSEDEPFEREPFRLMKLTLTSQEWCGHVFEEVQVRDGAILGDLNSYFEREGRQSWRFDRPGDFASEDHLLIEIRELKGVLMEEGETRAVTLLPSLWHFRLRHKARELVQATLHKGVRETVEVQAETYEAVPWTWTYDQREKTVWVDTAYPHRIVKWQDASGGSGELMASMRLPYWSLHDLDDEHLRAQLKIPR